MTPAKTPNSDGIFSFIDIFDSRYWDIFYRRYLEIWILEIFEDLDIGDWILETGYWRFGFSRLDIGDMEIFGHLEILILEVCGHSDIGNVWRFGNWKYLEIWI